jgi:hypothetical protein
MNSFLPLILGSLSILGGIFGSRFVAGVSGGKVKVSPWYGRIWFIGIGLILMADGLAAFLDERHIQFRFLAAINLPRAQCAFLECFKIYNGVVVGLVGVFFSVYYFRRRDTKMGWLFVAFVVGGSIFAYDGIWDILNVCWNRLK